ncbi:MAG: ABC transporter permease subunit [Acidobacteria bacterium]|nr:ABC transporter permease subunit [Acidobacteriota bacterium]
MRNFLAILKKELQALFVSPIAYVVLAVFFAVGGYFFYIIMSSLVNQAIEMGFRYQQMGAPPPPIDMPFLVMRNFFGILSTILLFLIPMITMAAFAEEKRRGTMELLATSPITNTQLILGKFAAVLVFLLVMLAPTLLNTLLLYLYSEPSFPLAPVLVGYLGAFLLGGALLSVGLFVSSLTENQIVAAVVTFGIFIVLWVIDATAGMESSLTNETIKYLSVLNHYEDFTKGVLDTQHLVFYLSFIFLGLFLTSTSLDSAKWRQ